MNLNIMGNVTKKRIVIGGAVILVIASFLMIYMSLKKIPFNFSGFMTALHIRKIERPTKLIDTEKNIISYDSATFTQVEIYGQSIIWCSNSALKCTDKHGNERWSIDIATKQPLVKVSGQYILVADIDGKNFTVIKDRQKKWSKTLEGYILNVDINEEGYTCVIYQDKMSTTAITLFDPEGNERFTAGKSDKVMITSKISPSNKSILVSMLDTSGTKVNSTLEFIDTTGKILSSQAPVEHTIFSCINYLSGDEFIAIGDSSIVSFNKVSHIKWKKANIARILSSNVALGKYVIIAQSKQNKINKLSDYKSNITIYNNRNGNTHAQYQVSDAIKELEVYSNIIAANTGHDVFFINTSAELLTKCTSTREINKIRFFNTNEILIITQNGAKVVKLSY